ncbi:MAG: hypothetical protein ACKVRP_08755 [Bacteroidota bacterium]
MAKERKRPDLEYRLLITPSFDERRQLPTTLFLLHTVQYFAAFQYEISVQEKVDGKSVYYKVLGLKAPQLNLPAAGHARYMREYDNLRGNYDVTVEGLDERKNTFTVKIAKEKVHIVNSPAPKFVDLIVDRAKWSETLK